MGERSAKDTKRTAENTLSEMTGSFPLARSLFRSNLVRTTGQDSHRSIGGQALLIVSGDGEILEVLQAPETADGEAPSSLIGAQVDDVWPGEPEGRIAKNAKRAIRRRIVDGARRREGVA